MNQSLPEIALKWEPAHPRSRLWFNVPLNTKRVAKLTIQSRVGEGIPLIIKEPTSPWLKITKRTGKVPFSTLVMVDTTGLKLGQGFKEVVEFQANNITIHQEPIYLTTQVYDPNEEPILQQTFAPLQVSKPKRNILISIYIAISTAYHIAFSFVVVWLLLLAICIVLVIVMGAMSR